MDLKHICEQTADVARLAGNFIDQESKKFNTDAVEYKDINNVVSYVDKEAEKLIVDALKLVLPEAGFITEEGTADTSDMEGYNWIIDPLDGTANFIHGLPNYSVSLALAKGKEVYVGVVYHICTKDIFYAVKGQGAFRNGEKISVSKAKKLGESLFATGFPYYKFQSMEKYLQILEALMQKTHGLRRFGSAAIDLAYVACGYFDGFFEYNLNSWDMAAGVLLIQEAGGTVTDFNGGQDYLFGGNIVAGSAVHQELLDEIQRFWK
ncbi:inositol monophosphatase [Emticicia sp. CRIBPO]|uniref:inositol monophosphatase family protein n=1 Tax=Emticicia sp. CRIBPO TaxID=2683258 RepID=UPI0014122BE0|nr:inositol monophosphatase family protein [Emticicia sp. CRIBPO]NBA84157.1 inositol monophosphatase [Emticicia sp. CRIBPO]